MVKHSHDYDAFPVAEPALSLMAHFLYTVFVCLSDTIWGTSIDYNATLVCLRFPQVLCQNPDSFCPLSTLT